MDVHEIKKRTVKEGNLPQSDLHKDALRYLPTVHSKRTATDDTRWNTTI